VYDRDGIQSGRYYDLRDSNDIEGSLVLVNSGIAVCAQYVIQ
jgi:hypothetical protein